VVLILLGLAAAAVCWAAALLGGPVAAHWTAAALTAASAVAALVRLPRPSWSTARTPRVASRGPTSRTTFDELARTMRWAQADRRYHERVLVPLLDRLRAEVEDPGEVDALRDEVAAALDHPRPRSRRWT
jgi:hypothetical protein